ncbi:hypothetical protein A1Q2_04083 [Trichosporon asahii var. asahii CBS 8904]|uniref:Nascent polypeptide-associated complex subunit alpha-like UBA domain-containing protein n=1 Tax=Trichosporon asahii var. asahii (strain CBS 8904) TaxID=1220162 RepID=K1VQ02_TRIAC|nr:hypothetical protein A1Q2_04083 [Trichosporon asahii var. asahii CBS 8904]
MASAGRVPQGEVIMDIVEADRNTDKLEDSALNLERRKIKREEGAKAAKALESLDVKPAEEMKGADVDLIVSIAGRRRCDRGLGGYLSIVRVQLGCGELGVSKEEAQAALRAEKGDVVKALVQLTAPGRR